MKQIRYAYLMEWQQIVGFYNVAKLGSFTKAAEATARTQSALSQQIKCLEQELDCQLFERVGRRRSILTSSGKELYRFAQSILDSYEGLIDRINEIKGLQMGRLSLAAPFTTLYHLLPEKLPSYVERFPRVQLTIFDRPQSSVVEMVRRGDVDFGMVLESFAPRDLAATRWKTVEVVLMVPKGHPLTRGDRVTFGEIARYPLIMPPKGLTVAKRQDVEEKLRETGVSYRIVMESSNVELSSVYVEMGLGLSFATIAKGVPVIRQRNLQFISLNQHFGDDHLAVLTRKDKVLGPHKKAFIDTLIADDRS